MPHIRPSAVTISILLNDSGKGAFVSTMVMICAIYGISIICTVVGVCMAYSASLANTCKFSAISRISPPIMAVTEIFVFIF